MTVPILISTAISLALSGASLLLQPSRNEKVQQGKIDNFTEPRGSFGDIISDIWGVGRVSGILIFGIFPPEEVVSRETTSQGKGPRNTTTTETYTYFGDFAFLLCTKSTQVEEIRFNSKLVYKNGSTDPIISAGGGIIRVQNGSDSQGVDSLLSATLGDRALAYRGRTYIVCENIPLEEFGNAFPQCSAKVRNGTPKLSEVISDICLQSSDLTANDIDVSELTNIDVRGFQTDSESTIAEKLQALQRCYFFDLIDTGTKLKFQKQFRPEASAFLPVAQLGAHEENSERPRPWRESRPDRTQLPSRVEVKFLDIDRSLEANTIQSVVFPTADHTRVETIDFSGALSTSEAKAIANRTLWKVWTESRTQEFTLSPKFANLEAGDVIELEIDSQEQQLQIESISYGANHLLQVKTKAYNPLIYGWEETNPAPNDPDIISPPPLPPIPPKDTPLPIVSPTTLKVLDIPLAYSTDTPGIYAFADGDANWRNATLYISRDLGVTYDFAENIVTRSIFGLCLTIFNGTSVDVRVPFHASLASISEALFLEGRNRSLIGAEIVDFQNATLTGNIGSDQTYQLTAPFTRGIRGTSQSHAANEEFYLLSGYKLNLPAQRSDIGKTFYFKAVSPGQTLADVTPVILVFQGRAFQVVIDDFSPRQGAITSIVTITGLGFTGATAVLFNNVPAQSFTVVSDTTLTAVVATGTTTGKIKVTAPLGIGVSAVDFTIVNDASLLAIQDEGNLVGARPTLNFIGPNVTATDNPGNNRVDITVTPPSIQDEGNLVGARPTLNFIGPNVTATDNPGNNRVDITVTPPSIQDEGNLVGARPTLNFIGANVSAIDNSGSDRVEVTINSQDFISGLIEAPTIKTYPLDYRVFRAYRLTQISLGTRTGTATVSIQINGNNVVGFANLAVTTTSQTFVATSGNLASIGSKIDFVVSAASSPTDLAFTLVFEYA